MDECGNYYLEDGPTRLGRGGFGEVFPVTVYNRTKTHQKEYARKYFSPVAENNATPIRQVADLRERFLVEIKTQCYLNALNYDVIAPIVLFNNEGSKPYFVMELAECNLQTLIEQGMSDTDKADAIQQILNGIELIHSNQYIHRDLKPGNILKYSNGRYKITDFGLVKDLDDVRAEVKTRFQPNGMGSDGYRAPEITDNGIFSVQSDIYAVGKIISDVYGRTAPQEINLIINKCTSFLPEYRYSSIDELRKDFVAAVNKVVEAV
ncbi:MULTISPECIES: protein kinase domain-containing protein [Vibrio]|nr:MULTISPECIES: protein kinase [Vibrio]EGR2264338.1 protein kinase [Vibrio parahaemolyticus]EHK0753457.1 protein kinase [Vibrio parahaemolyticus]EHR6685989.1 protein kinase [Vibrio parahaemolyticus]EHR6714583.1 protein kinase [Vibrio parahaemolyticus]EJA3434009.1 protein kinase [Vibrio parahaemolyticus]